MKKEGTHIVSLSLNNNKYSETFIHNQVKLLPANVHCLYGGHLSKHKPDGTLFLPNDGFSSLIRAAKEILLKNPIEEQHKKAIEDYLISNNIKAVIANYSVTAFPIMAICKRNNIPLIVHFHGWTAYRKSILEHYRKEYAELFAMASAVIGVSNDMIQQLQRIGCPKEKLHLITYGSNSTIFKFSNHADNRPIYLAIGRFCNTKSPHLTILAFQKVLQRIPDAQLRMIGGDENLLDACIALVKSLGMQNQVSFLGIKTPNEVYDEMKNALAFVQHSITTTEGEKEGTPVSIIEASASGLPVIATFHAGIPDVILHNETGLLCNEFDIETMAKHMIQLAEDGKFAKELGEKGSERINKHFTMDQYISKLWAVIDSHIIKD